MPVGRPINMLKGTWTRLLDTERLRRSSQVLSVIDQTVFIFGGEVKPREPVDDKVDLFSLKSGMLLSNMKFWPSGYLLTQPRRCTSTGDQKCLNCTHTTCRKCFGCHQWQSLSVFWPRRCRHGAHRRGRCSMEFRYQKLILVQDHASRLFSPISSSTQLPCVDFRRPKNLLRARWLPRKRPLVRFMEV